MIYDWVRLVLGIVAIFPPLAFTVVLIFSRSHLRAVPRWLTWTQSFALAALYAGVIGSSVEVILYGQRLPSVPIELVLILSYIGLASMRYLLFVWWVLDWLRRRGVVAHAPVIFEVEE